MKRLPQSYNRTGARTFDYASPRHDYHATLLIDDFSAVIYYLHLWTMGPRLIAHGTCNEMKGSKRTFAARCSNVSFGSRAADPTSPETELSILLQG